MNADVKTLDDYVTRYGRLIAHEAMSGLDPLHQPGRDEVLSTKNFLRTPYPAQQHLISALAKLLQPHFGRRKERSAIVAGEPGTGKTLIGSAIGHVVSKMHTRTGYRCLVMAPDHLKKKWAREITNTIPRAKVTIVDNWRDVWELAMHRPHRPAPAGKRGRRHAPAKEAEWYVLGRDQSKFDPSWRPAVAIGHHWEDTQDHPHATPEQIHVCRATGRALIKVPHYACPKCGRPLMTKMNTYMRHEEMAKTKRTCPGGKDKETGRLIPCGEILWQFTAKPAGSPKMGAWQKLHSGKAPADLRRPERRKKLKMAPYRYAPARLVHKYLKKYFDLFVLDEAHEEKSDESAQGIASGKIMASARANLAMTGTLIGGYAWHLFALLWRLFPRHMADAGFEWGKPMAFVEQYGRIEEQVITEIPAPRADMTASMGRITTKRKKKCLPGIVPSLFGEMLIGNTVFMALEEVSDALPPRPKEEIYAIEMDSDQKALHDGLEGAIRQYIAPMLASGDISLLSRMLHGLLEWPDHPFGWDEIKYFHPFEIYQLPDMDRERVFPKEQAMVDWCAAEAERGRQCWIYCEMTRERDIQGRLKDLLGRAGLKAEILRSDTVDRQEREEWIWKVGRKVDVCLSNPRIVETGLDLFDPNPGGANFPSLAFYQPGYSTVRLIQAGHRAWRIGQAEACRVAYFFYKDTMQDRAMSLMAKKLIACEALDGRFSTEGLAALADDESMEMALARTLTKNIESADRAWQRYRPEEQLPTKPTYRRLADAAPAPPAAEPVVTERPARNPYRDASGQAKLF